MYRYIHFVHNVQYYTVCVSVCVCVHMCDVCMGIFTLFTMCSVTLCVCVLLCVCVYICVMYVWVCSLCSQCAMLPYVCVSVCSTGVFGFYSGCGVHSGHAAACVCVSGAGRGGAGGGPDPAHGNGPGGRSHVWRHQGTHVHITQPILLSYVT